VAGHGINQFRAIHTSGGWARMAWLDRPLAIECSAWTCNHDILMVDGDLTTGASHSDSTAGHGDERVSITAPHLMLGKYAVWVMIGLRLSFVKRLPPSVAG